MGQRDDSFPDGANTSLAPLPSTFAFVVQFGRDTDVGTGHFVGQVEHLASARQRRFATREELFAFISERLAGTEVPG